MRNSKGVPSQLGLPYQPMGFNARYPDWAASLSARKDRKCGANLMEDNRIDD
jgi:hypothetical protein